MKRRKLPELVSGAEVARRLGVSRQRVTQWAASPRSGFPAPHGRIGYSNIYVWAEVQAWNAKRTAKAVRPAMAVPPAA